MGNHATSVFLRAHWGNTSVNNNKASSQVTNTNKATNSGVSNAKNNITPKTVKESNVISIPVFVPESIVVTGGNVVSSVTSKVVSVAIKWSSPVILGANAWWSQSVTAGGTLSDEQIKEQEGNATQGEDNTDVKEPASPGSMQKKVEKEQAPKEVDRVDKPHVPGQKPHVHFKDGTL